MIFTKDIKQNYIENIGGRFFRLISATAPVTISFIDKAGSKYTTEVIVGMQIPLGYEAKALHIESSEPQNITYWWSMQPSDYTTSKAAGAGAVKARRVTVKTGETLLTLPNAIRKELQITTDQDLFIGGLGDGENGWPIKAGEVLTLPLAGSLYAYKKPTGFSDDLLTAEYLSKDFQNDTGQPDSTEGSFSTRGYFGVNRKIKRDSYSNTANFLEYNPETDDFDIIHKIIFAEGETAPRTEMYNSKYHNQVIYCAKSNTGVVIGEFDMNGEVGQNRIVTKFRIDGNPSLNNAKVFKRQNGDYVFYDQYFIVFVNLGSGNTQYDFNYNELDFGDSGFGMNGMSEFDGVLYSYIKDGGKYKWAFFNESSGQWQQAENQFVMTHNNAPSYNGTFSDVGAFVTIGNDSNYKDLFAFVDEPITPTVIEDIVSGDSPALDYIAGVVFFNDPDTGQIYSTKLDNPSTKALTAAIGDNSRPFNHYNLLYDVNDNKLVATVNPSAPADIASGDVRIAHYPSPFVGNVGGAKVQLLEFIA